MADRNKKAFITARDEILNSIREDIIGPENDDELISEAPTTRYSASILFPKEGEVDTQSDLNAERTISASSNRLANIDEAEELIEQTSSFFPSAMGLSFIVNNDCTSLELQFNAGKYRRITPGDYPISVPAESIETIPADTFFTDLLQYENKRLVLKRPIDFEQRQKLIDISKNNAPLIDAIFRVSNYTDGWKRINVTCTDTINPQSPRLETKIASEHISLILNTKPDKSGNARICTITAINTAEAERQADNEKSYFQVNFALKSNDGAVFQPFDDTLAIRGADAEEESLQLLYRKRRFFAAGHGISADWELNDVGTNAHRIFTEATPTHSVPQMEFDLPGEQSQSLDLSMRHFSDDSDESILNTADSLVDAYNDWISSLSSEASGLATVYSSAADANIDACKEAVVRMQSGIAKLREDDQIMTAFKLANKAMLMQRVHSNLQSTKHYSDESYKVTADYDTRDHIWRPFQLAFILLNIESMADPSSESRDLVDLIWFPTGGGKTEAYLGLTAYTIFLRRLKHDNSGGTTVLMRYTLRLLTSQQFQRACTLICACEKLRRDGHIKGEPITIGQWLGQASSPNNLKDADIKLRDLSMLRDGTGKNPFQVLSCPWCSTYMAKKDGRGLFGYRMKSNPKRFSLLCPNNECEFNDELPIRIVDEDIYNAPPTLLFGTVDKFARLPWVGQASSIFALNKNNLNLSPELIIQDELHLISGSLGTMVGIYETAIDLLCSHKNVRPKIIASTATIRRSKDQCKALYARDVRQFPAPGLDASDSFFAREASISDSRPGRQYVGVMPSGKTSTTMQVRLLASAIQGTDLLKADEEIKDSYWTQVVYCNSIRELGTSQSIVNDDVKEYSKRFADRHGVKPRYYTDREVQELTSRVSPESIPEILQQLDVSYPAKDAIDVLLATNMISVGVDIDRLGLMMVLGQPKTTSEYIQASSRVGRKNPGLVITLYSPVKSRDRSHFEQFKKYHQALYRYVEPTSVTPFSSPVRDKALAAVVITLVRHMLGFIKNEDLMNFDFSSDTTKALVQNILNRVSLVDSAEAGPTETEIENILRRIGEMISQDAGASYDKLANSEKVPIMHALGDKKQTGFSVPQSMRNTDAECYIRLDYSK